MRFLEFVLLQLNLVISKTGGESVFLLASISLLMIGLSKVSGVYTTKFGRPRGKYFAYQRL